MNKTKRTLLSAALAALSLATLAPLAAQPGNRGGGGPGGNNLDFLAGYLSLTDAQKTQAKTIFDAATTAINTAQGQLTAAHDALEAAVKANRSDAELDRLAAAVGVIEGQIEGIRAKASARFYALLTAEQKTKYDALLARRSGLGGGR